MSQLAYNGTCVSIQTTIPNITLGSTYTTETKQKGTLWRPSVYLRILRILRIGRAGQASDL